MDKTLNLKQEDFNKALATLTEILNEPASDIVRDAIIKRFEYTFDAAWKTAKVMLFEKFGVDVFSPKTCFRELRRNKLISDEDTEKFLAMVDDRNTITHVYGRQQADEIAEKIKTVYTELLKKLNQIINSKS
ncbi:MAG: HI0074 family nucleotidyltransferase substrate-binding subunit [bacterium]|nr:HI0074 family nucleotidyltransferase substrate-binding subunit [bacterium]